MADLDQLTFEPKNNTVIDCLQYADHERVHCQVQKLSDIDLHRWLTSHHPNNGTPERGLRIVVTDRVRNDFIQPNEDTAALTHLPFSRDTFLELMNHFNLSSSFVRTILRGNAEFYHCVKSEPTYPLHYFNMRMDHSWPKDLAMSASGNTKTAISYALYHGCDEQDVETLTEWLSLTADSVGHPMLLPALFAEMQLRRHRRFTKKNWRTLVTQYAQTGQYGGIKEENILDFEKSTRDVLTMHQSTGFLEKDLVQFQRRLKKLCTLLAKSAADMPQSRQIFMTKNGSRIGERLEEMIDEYESLIVECRRITDGATILTGAIWNLIAQRNNISQQSIAADSRKIAAAARRDSSAMKTIAVLTMIFLPGTFVAAFFGIPLFNWNAPAGESVISDRFWVYWAVTIPLTASLFLFWIAWYLLFGPEGGRDEKTREVQVKEVTNGNVRDDEHWSPKRELKRLRKTFSKPEARYEMGEPPYELYEDQRLA